MSIAENGAAVIDVLANDSNPDGTARLTLISVTATSADHKGVFSIAGSRVKFDPGVDYDFLAAGQTRTATADYVAEDRFGARSTGQITLTVTGSNDAPIVVSDTQTITEDQNIFIDLLGNDRDPEGSALTITDLVAPEGRGTGTLVRGGIGFRPSDLLDRLAPGDTTSIVFRYNVSDGTGGVTASLLTVTVQGVNDAPIAKRDRIGTLEDTAVTIDPTTLTRNDTDVDDNQTLSLTSVSNATNGVVEMIDGKVKFTPAANFYGNAGFDYSISDGAGGTATGHAIVPVGPVNDKPVAVNDSVIATEDVVLTGSVFAANGGAADFDPDNPLKVGALNGQVSALRTGITLASGATVKLNSAGVFTYDDHALFGSLTGVVGAANHFRQDTFTYTLVGGNTATVTVNLIGVSDPTDIALGTPGNDTMTGTGVSEQFALQAGGDDVAFGGGGGDGFYFGAKYTAADRVDGGAATLGDAVVLQGNYTTTLLGSSLVGIEILTLLSGFDPRYGGATNQPLTYALTATQDFVAANSNLLVVGATLAQAETFSFDASAAGNAANSTLSLVGHNGSDTFVGSNGNVNFIFGAGAFGADDHVDGGTMNGAKSLFLQGNYTLSLSNQQVRHVDAIVLVSAADPRFPVPGQHYNYDITLHDLSNERGFFERLLIDGSGLQAGESLHFNGSGNPYNMIISGGSGDDVIYGGASASEIISAGAGSDFISTAFGSDARVTGGAGADHIVLNNAGRSARVTVNYDAVAESSGAIIDVIENFDFNTNRTLNMNAPYGNSYISLLGTGTQRSALHLDPAANNATINSNTFVDSMTSALNGVLTAHGVSFVTATQGDLAGHFYVAFDVNNVAGYQAGADVLIEFVNPLNFNTPADLTIFIV